MQKFYLISLTLFFIVSLCSTSLFCPYSVYPSSDSDFEKLRVEVHTQEDDLISQPPIYRLKKSLSMNNDFEEIKGEKEEGFISPNGEKPFRLFTRALSSECPKRGCLHELALAEPRIPGTLFYHTDTIMGKVIPPGFLTVEANPRLYCAIVSDDCGANIPIYRHFKMVGPRVYYAYSTSPEIEIPGNFTREQMPMCFGWSNQRPSPEKFLKLKKHENTLLLNKNVLINEEENKEIKIRKNKKSEGNEKINNNLKIEENEDKEMKKLIFEGEEEENKKVEEKIKNNKDLEDECLNISPMDEINLKNDSFIKNKENRFAKLTVYDNRKIGTLHDHLYTTNNSVPQDYKNESQLGFVLTKPIPSKCPIKCLNKLGQMLANRSEALGIFPMNDHKIVLMGKESADTFYTSTGEVYYCAKKEGQCGATLAVRRYWHLVEMDTILTVNSTIQPPLTISTWDGVICYIWSDENKDFKNK